MAIEYLGLSEINGPLVVLEGVQGAAYDEIVEMTVGGTTRKIGRIIEIYGDKAIIQVFEGTEGMALRNTHTRLTGHPMEIAVSEEMLGRTFNGIGEPIDGLGDIISDIKLDVNGKPLNPVTREYPRNYIRTGISAIDGLTTLIRGQKLPIFSGNGLPHDQLAAQIVQQASLGDDSDEQFAIVFGAMGVKYDVADFFRRTFEESGVSEHVAMFINLANDPVVERLITPKVVLTLAEYLAFEKGMHILVILTDMTSYAEAMREVSSSKGEIPSRKGFPGYLYSDLASIYERAGIVAGRPGLRDPDSHSDHAKRRHHPPDPGPDRVHHGGADRAGPPDVRPVHLSAHQRAPQPVPSDEGRHRRGLHQGRSPGCGQPAVLLLRQGGRRESAGLRHRRG